MKKIILTLILIFCSSTLISPVWAESEASADIISINLSDPGSSDHFTWADNELTITKGGFYILSGELSGRLKINISKDEDIFLSFNGLDISNASAEAIYIKKARSVTISLAEGSVNKLSSGSDESEQTDKNALYCTCPLTICGSGTLNITADIYNGIHCSSDLNIESGIINISSAHNAIKAQNILISGGKFTINAANKAMNSSEELTVTGGTFTLTCADDAVHAGSAISVEGGTFSINAGDDAFHSDSELYVKDGIINIASAYEGLEAHKIYISGGMLTIVTKDDGLNTGNEIDRSDLPGIFISGGDIYIYTEEDDGIDSNGDLLVSGGTLLVDGCSSQWASPLDWGGEYGGSITISEGTVWACGMANMAGHFTSDSLQCSVKFTFLSGYAAQDIITISTKDGEELYSHKMLRKGDSVVFSCDKLTAGESYLIKINDEEHEFIQESVSTQIKIK